MLNQAWDELKQMASNRGKKLDESLTYQQFLAKVEEEEAWIRLVKIIHDLYYYMCLKFVSILFSIDFFLVKNINYYLWKILVIPWQPYRVS